MMEQSRAEQSGTGIVKSRWDGLDEEDRRGITEEQQADNAVGRGIKRRRRQEVVQGERERSEMRKWRKGVDQEKHPSVRSGWQQRHSTTRGRLELDVRRLSS